MSSGCTGGAEPVCDCRTAELRKSGEQFNSADTGMLIEKLGYRAPPLGEAMRLAARTIRKRSRFGPAARKRFDLPNAVLHAAPLVSYSGIVPRAPLGVASHLRGRLRTKTGWFLLSPTWSIEDPKLARALRGEAVLHRMLNPGHRFVFMCNTEREAEIMRAAGEAAVVHNKTTNVSEDIFRPLAGERIAFDAIYNAQLAPWKRHELTLDIPDCAFLFYRGVSSTSDSEAALIAHHRAHAPGHVFINEIDADGMPVRLPAGEVNRHLNRAAVGLCLSETEGAMFACAEYLLAGLPVVTTPNTGGRDFFVDGEFCITVPANPRDIAEAVAALKAKNIPRDSIRERTLRRIGAERARYIGLVNAILEECGMPEDFHGFWPLKRPVIMEWTSPNAARKRAAKGKVDEVVIRD